MTGKPIQMKWVADRIAGIFSIIPATEASAAFFPGCRLQTAAVEARLQSACDMGEVSGIPGKTSALSGSDIPDPEHFMRSVRR